MAGKRLDPMKRYYHKPCKSGAVEAYEYDPKEFEAAIEAIEEYAERCRLATGGEVSVRRLGEVVVIAEFDGHDLRIEFYDPYRAVAQRSGVG